jgi:sarcosine oxidase subunit gamma
MPKELACVADLLNREHGSLESCCSGQFGAPTPHAGITFIARAHLSLVDLRGDPQDDAFLASAASVLGAALPLKPNTTAAGADCDILWLGPDQWLLAGRDGAKVNEALAIDHGFLTDVSHGRSTWRVSGPRTLNALAKSCSLDLHPRVFLPGTCAQTALAHVGVLLHRLDAGCFEVYCARSYAQHLWHCLTEAASEYGYEVLAPV